MAKRNRRLLRWAILLGGVLAAGLYGYVQNNWIDVERFIVPIEHLPPAFHGYTIAHVSDVHLDQHAASIDHILQLVRDEEPDLIVLTGDSVDQGTSLEDSGLDRLCHGLAGIAPTYAVSGNHEHIDGRVEKWRNIVASTGVTVLDNQLDTIVLDGAQMLIAGLEDDVPYSPELFAGAGYVETTLPMLLLAHRPELFASYASDESHLRPDLVFSGHAHGGQFRIPFFNLGMVAPNQGLFPAYSSGLYTSDSGMRMVVSRGLGNSIIPVRIHNRPHLPVIQLVEAAS